MSNLEKMVAKVKANNQPGIAITDHGNMYGAVEFYKLAKKYEVKPIIGLEAYCAIEDSLKKTNEEKSPYHLTLLAEKLFVTITSAPDLIKSKCASITKL